MSGYQLMRERQVYHEEARYMRGLLRSYRKAYGRGK